MPELLEDQEQATAETPLGTRPNWDKVAPLFSQAFPDMDQAVLRQRFEGARELGEWRDRLAGAEERPETYLLRNAAGPGSSLLEWRGRRRYRLASERMANGIQEPGDAEAIAVQERLAEIDQNRSTLGKVGTMVAGIPAFAAEMVATGGAFRAGSAAAQTGARAIGATGIVRRGAGLLAGSAAATAANPIRVGAAIEGQRTPIGPTDRIPDAVHKGFWEALPSGAFDAFVETFTERVGGTRPVRRLAGAVSSGATAALSRIGITPNSTTGLIGIGVANRLRRMGISNPISEIGEERLGEVMRGIGMPLLGGQGDFGAIGQAAKGEWGNFFSQVAIEGAAFTLWSGGSALSVQGAQSLLRSRAGPQLQQELQRFQETYGPYEQGGRERYEAQVQAAPRGARGARAPQEPGMPQGPAFGGMPAAQAQQANQAQEQAPEAAEAPAPTQAAPEAPASAQAAPRAAGEASNDVGARLEAAGRAFQEVFPNAAASQNRPVIRAEAKERWIEIGEGQTEGAVRLDFGAVDQRVGRQKFDQPITLDLGRLVKKLHGTGVMIEYVATEGRERAYAAYLKRSGYEQVSGPTGVGGELRVWRPINRILSQRLSKLTQKARAADVKAPTPAPAEVRPVIHEAPAPVEAVDPLTPFQRHLYDQIESGKKLGELVGDPKLQKPKGGQYTTAGLHKIYKAARLLVGQPSAAIKKAGAKQSRRLGEVTTPGEVNVAPRTIQSPTSEDAAAFAAEARFLAETTGDVADVAEAIREANPRLNEDQVFAKARQLVAEAAGEVARQSIPDRVRGGLATARKAEAAAAKEAIPAWERYLKAKEKAKHGGPKAKAEMEAARKEHLKARRAVNETTNKLLAAEGKVKAKEPDKPVPQVAVETFVYAYRTGDLYALEKTQEVLKESSEGMTAEQVRRVMAEAKKVAGENLPPLKKRLIRGTNAQNEAETFKGQLREAIEQERLGVVPHAIPSMEEESVLQAEAALGGFLSETDLEFPFGMPTTAAEEAVIPSGGQENATGRTPGREMALANAKVDEERVKNGLPPLMAAARQSNPSSWDKAMELLENDPMAAQRLVDDLTKKPRVTNVVEGALLLHRRISLNNEHRRAMLQQIKAFREKADDATLSNLEARERELFKMIDQLDKATRRTGTEIGRALQFRRQLAREDFSLAGMLMQAMAAKGRELTLEEKNQLVELNKKIEELQRQLAEAIKSGKTKAGEPSDTDFELVQLQQTFKRGLKKDREERDPWHIRALRVGGGIFNLPRSIMASIDFPLLRQGMVSTLAHPIRTAKIVPEMLRAFVSERAAERSLYEIQHRPTFERNQAAGLEITDRFGPLNRQEEGFMANLIAKIPILGKPLAWIPKASERSYQTVLNRIRADTMDFMAANLARKGELTGADLEVLANFANVSTGRGYLGIDGEKALTVLNHTFFAPKWAMSRFQMVLGQPLWTIRGGLAPHARIEVAKEYGRMLAGLGAVLGMALLAGWKFEWDPRSPDFLKLKLGRTRMDLTGGMGSVTTFLSRLSPWGGVKVQSGRVRPVDAGDIGRFVRQKLAPVPAAALDLRLGRNVVGQRITPQEVGLNVLSPLFLRDVVEVMKDVGVPKGTALSLLGLMGMSMQTYGNRAVQR